MKKSIIIILAGMLFLSACHGPASRGIYVKKKSKCSSCPFW